MSSIAPVNSGLADLIKALSNTGSASVSSSLSSAGVQSALQNANPRDVVHLSLAAQQLQEVNGLFGSNNASQTTATPDTLLLQALNSSITGKNSSILGTTSETSSDSSTNPNTGITSLFG
jgi:hypothetical protein